MSGGWTPTAIPTLLHCLTLFSDFESSNSLVRVAAVPQFPLMYLEKQTRITMALWKVKENLILSFCFEKEKQNSTVVAGWCKPASVSSSRYPITLAVLRGVPS